MVFNKAENMDLYTSKYCVGKSVGGKREEAIFSLDTMAFTPGSTMATRRWGLATVALDEHRIMVAGGYSDSGLVSNTTEVLDIRTMTFAPGPSMGLARLGCAAVPVDARHVPVVGGQSSSTAFATTELFDVATMAFESGPTMQTADALSQTRAVVYTFPFALPPFYIAIIRCLGVLEGVAMQVDPLFRIVSDAYPFVAARLLTGDAPELQLALRNLLFKDDQPQWSRLEALVDRATAAQDYDATKAILLFVDLSSSDLRKSSLDAVVVETARGLLKAVGLDLPEHVFQTAQKGKRRTGSTEDEERPPVARVHLRARDALRAQTNDISRNPELALGAANERRLLEHATVRRVAAEVAAKLTERFASRAIRLGSFRFV
ncbi:hypothetical protein M885DRAFT_573234 [Pelagophyceae sp. CCMP2097]|nr:hypothetical protein M885DRAFT_573234 [Pelagophyceae sp. CCMP2097]